MADTIKIRACRAGDVPRLRNHEPPNADIALGFLHRQDAGDIIYATAWDGDEARGGAVLDFRADPVPELKHLFVYPADRGNGVGRALCEWIEDQARRAGDHEIRLGVAPDNRVAIGLHTSLGYVPTGDIETTSYDYIDADGEQQNTTEAGRHIPEDSHTGMNRTAVPAATAREPRRPKASSSAEFGGCRSSADGFEHSVQTPSKNDSGAEGVQETPSGPYSDGV